MRETSPGNSLFDRRNFLSTTIIFGLGIALSGVISGCDQGTGNEKKEFLQLKDLELGTVNPNEMELARFISDAKSEEYGKTIGGLVYNIYTSEYNRELQLPDNYPNSVDQNQMGTIIENLQKFLLKHGYILTYGNQSITIREIHKIGEYNVKENSYLTEVYNLAPGSIIPYVICDSEKQPSFYEDPTTNGFTIQVGNNYVPTVNKTESNEYISGVAADEVTHTCDYGKYLNHASDSFTKISQANSMLAGICDKSSGKKILQSVYLGHVFSYIYYDHFNAISYRSDQYRRGAIIIHSLLQQWIGDPYVTVITNFKAEITQKLASVNSMIQNNPNEKNEITNDYQNWLNGHRDKYLGYIRNQIETKDISILQSKCVQAGKNLQRELQNLQ